MRDKRTNIILIGMPGAGKSTVGVILAKKTARDFVDTDVIIQTDQMRSLQQIVDHDGHLALRRIEEETLLRLLVINYVIATGGSAVYSSRAMVHLKSTGVAVFLDVHLETLKSRVGDFRRRGLAKTAEQSFAELYEERVPLYRQWADVTVECDGFSHEEVTARIVEAIEVIP